MNREVHVRVCEGLRGKFPRPTRLQAIGTVPIRVISVSDHKVGFFSDMSVRHRISSHGHISALLQ